MNDTVYREIAEQININILQKCNSFSNPLGNYCQSSIFEANLRQHIIQIRQTIAKRFGGVDIKATLPHAFCDYKFGDELYFALLDWRISQEIKQFIIEEFYYWLNEKIEKEYYGIIISELNSSLAKINQFFNTELKKIEIINNANIKPEIIDLSTAELKSIKTFRIIKRALAQSKICVKTIIDKFHFVFINFLEKQQSYFSKRWQWMATIVAIITGILGLLITIIINLDKIKL